MAKLYDAVGPKEICGAVSGETWGDHKFSSFWPNSDQKEVRQEFLGILELMEQVSEPFEHLKHMYSHFLA